MRRLAVLAVLPAALACDDGPASTPPPAAALRAVQVVAGLESPVHVVSPPGDARLFVVEQPGRVRIVRAGALQPGAFLDIRARVAAGGERGLLSLAFHPDFAANGLFFVNYTDLGGATRIERYRVGTDPDAADPTSGALVLAVDQPYANHNGGHLLFGPDGYLYVAMGDGGSAGDPQGHAQDPGTLLGALLRLDIDGATPYAIPADNPFVTGGGRPEVWAIGLRNPWRIAFDLLSATLWVADVGQGAREEVNAVAAGQPAVNYGWNRYEGTRCYREPCAAAGLTMPVHEYPHEEGCSISGGFVYRGSAIPELRGHYLYSDYCAGWVRSLRLADGAAVDHRDWDVAGLAQVTSFGQDRAGEPYITTADGRLLRLEPDR